MDWEGQRESENVEDRRGLQKAGLAVGGGAVILAIIVGLLTGRDPQQLLNQIQNQQGSQGSYTPANPAEERQAKLVKVILASTEDVWDAQFKKMGKRYKRPRLVLFSGQVQSACGFADAAVGPFYCPGDQQVYLDLGFFQELEARFKAPGDFARAYVVAHEVGHHVQNLLGITRDVENQRRQMNRVERNHLSVQVELQADFLAGVWGYHARKQLNLQSGDLESALRAARSIGDDMLQKQARGYVVPDSFTHGTSEQRIRWFKKGFETGDIDQGDTFHAKDL